MLDFGVVGGRRMVVVDVGGQRKPTTTKNEHECSISGVVSGGSQREPSTAESGHAHAIPAVMVGLLVVVVRGNPQPPKMSMRAQFWGLWGVTGVGVERGVAKEAHHRRKCSILRWWWGG